MTGAQRADAVRSLAALLRAGWSPRAALVDWHLHAPPVIAADLKRLARHVRLGEATDAAIERTDALGADRSVLATVVAMCEELGGRGATLLDRVAEWIDRRDDWASSGRSAGAGALLSGRLVAALPLVFVPLTPAARAPLLDSIGLATIAVGAALAVVGMRWIGRIVPRPPIADDPVAIAADLCAALLRGGVGLHHALAATARRVPDEIAASMQRAARRVQLGLSWDGALERSDDERLRSLAATIERASSTGTPVASALEHLAAERRGATRRDYDAAIRRAPVLMVIPLVLCVLPSFGLLALVPFLRGISFGG